MPGVDFNRLANYVPPDLYRTLMSHAAEAKPIKAAKSKTSKSKQIALPRPRYGDSHPASYTVSKPFKKAVEKISPETQALVDMVLDPDVADAAVRWPNTYGLSSTYKSINTINAAFDANKQSVVYVHPRISNAIFSTAGASFFQLLVPSGSTAGNFVYQDLGLNEDSVPTAYLTSPWYFNSNHVALPVPVNVPAGTVNFLYPISWNSTDATSIAQFTFTNIGLGDVGQLQMRMRWYAADYSLLNTVSQAVQANGVCQFTLNPAVATNTTAYISLEIFGAAHPYDGRVLGQLREVGAGPFMAITLSNTYTHCTVANLNGANLISGSSEEYVVLAQSLLCTHVGSTLQDGGVIATARVPADTAVGEKSEAGSDSAAGGNPHYNWISSLANNRYEGKVKNGCYSFYVGDDETAYFYRPVQEQIDSLPYLVAAFSTTDTATSVVRIKIISHIQFKSNSNVYAQLASPYYRDVAMIPHMLSVICSSYSNDDHKKSLKDTLKGMGQSLGRMLKNPKTWTTAAEIAAMLL